MDYIIIVAGGRGLRMGGDIPKQFMPIGGVPVLMRTLQRFRDYSPDLQIILVLPRDHQPYWRELCDKHHFTVDYQLADGGATRFHSVKNGLHLIPDGTKGVVGVHDGVRPFVSLDVIRDCFQTAHALDAVVPIVPVVESMINVKTGPVRREDFRIVQTPQVFNIQVLKKAYELDYTPQFTDDASVVVASGTDVAVVDGNRENIKLTTPFDLQLAEYLVTHQP